MTCFKSSLNSFIAKSLHLLLFINLISLLSHRHCEVIILHVSLIINFIFVNNFIIDCSFILNIYILIVDHFVNDSITIRVVCATMFTYMSFFMMFIFSIFLFINLFNLTFIKVNRFFFEFFLLILILFSSLSLTSFLTLILQICKDFS